MKKSILLPALLLLSCTSGDTSGNRDVYNIGDLTLIDTQEIRMDISGDVVLSDITSKDTEEGGNCNLICPNNSFCQHDRCICNKGYADCNHDMADGCEANLLNDTRNCGSCKEDCSEPMLGAIEFTCENGRCTVLKCREGMADCDKRGNNGCEIDVRTDSHNCGFCGRACMDNSFCKDSICECEEGFANCNLNIADGCEQNISIDSQNCGACGKRCGNNSYCSRGKCICNINYGDCNGISLDGCEVALVEDFYNCGYCGNNCSKIPNVDRVSCTNGLCNILSCKSGYSDCNNNWEDGCEANLWSDFRHCGSCAKDCGNNTLCDMGSCICKQDYLSCDGVSNNGCEIYTNDNTTCGKSCQSLINCHQNARCINQSCQCIQPSANCNLNWEDGCEIDTSKDRFNCGTCGHGCIDQNYSGVCAGSLCAGRHIFSRSFGSAGYDSAISIKVDSKGDIFVAGHFENIIQFGSTTLVSKGMRDIFVAKFDRNGSPIIIRSFGSTEDDIPQGIIIDKHDNVIITGYYSGAINFGTGEIPSYGGKDIFLAKFTNILNPVWSRGYGGTGDDRGIALSYDSNQNIILSGDFASSQIGFGGEVLSCKGCTDIFLAKFNSDSQHVFSKGFGAAIATNGCDTATSVITDNDDNIYLTGTFAIRENFGGADLITKGSLDIFLASFTKDGAYRYDKSYGSTGIDIGTSLTLTEQNNIVLSAVFSDSLTIANKNFISKGKTDILLAILDNNFNFITGRSYGSQGDDFAIATIDKDNNIIFTGKSDGIINLGFLNEDLVNKGGSDIILGKMKRLSNPEDISPILAYSFGSIADDSGTAITTDSSGNIYATGEFFGDLNFGGDTISHIGNGDIFLIKLSY